jgi:PAS domain S-box-containing protein
LTVQASYGMSPEEVHGLQFEREQDTPMWRALLERKPIVLTPTRPGIHPTAQVLFRRYGITSVLDMPLVFSGEVIGVVGVAQRGGRTFGDDDVALLETLGAYAGVALHNARLYKRIAESEARYRVLVENAQVAIVVVDPTRHITFWNRGAERLFGWTAQEVLRRHIELIYPEEGRPDVPREVLRHLDRNGYWFGEYAAIRKDGSRFTAFSSITRIVDPSGQVLGGLGILLDASEQVRLREQLLQAQKMETIGALAGGVAHDFNNLLTGILGFASLVKAGLDPNDEDYKATTQIEEAAERGTQLVRQLLTFSQKQPVAAQPVRLNKVIEEAVALLGRTLPKIITLVTRLDPNLHIIQADPTQMHQIIMNLAVNARDALPKGGSLTLTTENIYLTAEEAHPLGLEAGLHVRLTVSDTGAGMPPEVRRHVFEPFFTTKPKGTGLGLSTVYAIVTRHRGHVTCISEPGRGTTFGVTFAAVAQAADSQPPAIRE